VPTSTHSTPARKPGRPAGNASKNVRITARLAVGASFVFNGQKVYA
jgi:hypothetical protein